MKMIKQLSGLLLVILSIFMLVGCGKLTTYREISYAKYKDMIANKESFILYIGKASCSACAQYKGSINAVIKDYNVEVNYLDLEAMSTEENKEFSSLVNFSGTPTTIFIEDGAEKSVYNRIVRSEDYDSIVDMFRKNGYIK